MRILHIVGGSKFGGEAFVILNLARLAKSLGWEVDVLVTDPPAVKFYEEHGIGVVELDVIHRPINPIADSKGVLAIKKYLLEHPYEIVHTRTSKGGLLGRVGARMAGVPAIVHTVHGFAFHEESSKKAVMVFSGVEKAAAMFCDRIVTVSNYHAEWAIRLGIGNESKVFGVPNGIAADGIQVKVDRATMRAQWGVKNHDVVIVSTSRLAKQKGLEYLIRGVPMMKQQIKFPWKILLAGSGELEEELKALCTRVGADDKITFLGFQKDVGSIINAADVIALPSLWEGLSISLLEAMAAGKPIVTTSIGSNREVVESGKSAVIVPSKDIEAFANGLARVCNDGALRNQLSEAAKRRFQEFYTVEPMVEGYKRVYENLIAEKQGAIQKYREKHGLQ